LNSIFGARERNLSLPDEEKVNVSYGPVACGSLKIKIKSLPSFYSISTSCKFTNPPLGSK
jgi:hypothetical protein